MAKNEKKALFNLTDSGYPKIRIRVGTRFVTTIYNVLVFRVHAVTVWSEGFLYKVAPPELKISPIMYFVIHNSVVLSKILKIIVPFWPLFAYVDYYQNNQFNIPNSENRLKIIVGRYSELALTFCGGISDG